MCGITGFVHGAPALPAAAIIADQLAAIRHRGPDGSGTFSDELATLGMQRLAIIDLATGQQPMFSRDGQRVLVFNGEIYNYRQLRAQLCACGQQFDTTSDTEVLMRGIEAWGLERCLERLNGMFAIALWERSIGQLTLIRDRLGIKPLYVYQDGLRLVFGSEIKAILAHPGIERRLDLEGLINFLAWGHSIAPQTMVAGVRKLPPGHLLRFNAASGAVTMERYWRLELNPPLHPEPAAAAAECYTRLREAVRLQLVSDVPLGAFLSGGLDSSIIVGLMTQLGAAPVRTFSIGFDAPGSYNELDDARMVARHFGCEHHELRLQAADLPPLLDTLIWHYDEPFGDAAALPMLALARFARQHVTVALSGEGSDEQWAGYRRYRANLITRWLRELPGRRAVSALIRQLPRSRRLKQFARVLEQPGIHSYAAWLDVADQSMRQRLVSADVAAATARYDPQWQYTAFTPRGADPLTTMQYLDLHTWLPDTYLEKMDKATMAASLEARVPFLDHTLVEWAMRLPANLRLRGGSTKWLLRQAFADLLPAATLRKRKQGLAVPTDPWLRGELAGWTREILLDQRTRQRGLFQPAAIERLLDEHASGRHVHASLIWLLLNLELWQRRYLDAQ